MKIYLNKNIFKIHWSAYVSAILCFIAAYFIYKEYKEDKYLFEQGTIEKAIVYELPKKCSTYRRAKHHLPVLIISSNDKKELKITYEECLRANLNDTFIVRYKSSIKRILRYNAEVTKCSKFNLGFAIFAIILGLIFLLFGNDKNNWAF